MTLLGLYTFGIIITNANMYDIVWRFMSASFCDMLMISFVMVPKRSSLTEGWKHSSSKVNKYQMCIIKFCFICCTLDNQRSKVSQRPQELTGTNLMLNNDYTSDSDRSNSAGSKESRSPDIPNNFVKDNSAGIHNNFGNKWQDIVCCKFGYESLMVHLTKEFSIENLMVIYEVCCKVFFLSFFLLLVFLFY